MRAHLFAVAAPPLVALSLAGLPGCEADYVQLRNPRDLQTTEAAVDLEQVTRGKTDEVNPSISPNGKLLAYEARAEGSSEVVVAPVATPSRARFRVAQGTFPSWMPDGKAIVLVSEAEQGHWQVVKRELAAPVTGAILIPLGDPKNDALWPSVSSDGKTLATSLVNIGVFDSKNLRRRYFSAGLALMPTNGYGVPDKLGDGVESSWSPNPRDHTIAFIREADGHGHVFIAGPDGKAHQVTDGPDEDADPTWSPDGRYLAFCSAHSADEGTMSANANIFVVGRDGTQFTQITEGDGFACRPSWSSDGWIYFHATSPDQKGFHVWRVRWRSAGASRDLIPYTPPTDPPEQPDDAPSTPTEPAPQ